MVNINHVNELTQPMGGAAVDPPKAGKAGAFKTVLTQALGQAEETESPGTEASATAGLGEIPSTGLNLIDQPAIVSGKTDALLGLLDAYSNKLEDPGVSLKNIAPILEQINQNADSLLKESVSLGKGNQELKDIATRTIIAAQTEYLRFQRGDYVS